MTKTDPSREPGAGPDATSGGESFERAILGDAPSLTIADVRGEGAELTDTARRLWRAMGFPDPGDGAALTEADRRTIELVVALVEAGSLDTDTALKLTRAIGQTMARLAEWQVATVTEYVEGLEETGRGSGSRLRTGLGMLGDIEPPFEEVMLQAWRRHLAAAVARVEALGAADSDLHTVTVTVGFADLVSFTQLSHGLAEDRLADLVEGFESTCADLVTARSGRVIKTLGDSVLFVADSPQLGVDIACDVVEQVGGDPALPDVHVGLATGPVVMRLGDVFGSPVNLASRLTGVARRNRVICDEVTAAAVRHLGGYAQRPLTERGLRGFGAVRPVAVRRL